MFIEVDEGCYVNSENIFSITYKSYNNKGVWIFSSSHVEERDRNLADRSNRKIVSRSFGTKGEAEVWLEEILGRIGVVREKKKRFP